MDLRHLGENGVDGEACNGDDVNTESFEHVVKGNANIPISCFLNPF